MPRCALSTKDRQLPLLSPEQAAAGEVGQGRSMRSRLLTAEELIRSESSAGLCLSCLACPAWLGGWRGEPSSG